MLDLLSRRFYWNRMDRDVQRKVRACLVCQKRKQPRPSRAGLTQPMLSQRPMQTVAIDLVGPLIESVEGDKWILTMMDTFTRWPIAVPVPNKSAIIIARAIYRHLLCQHECPERILTDREKSFLSQGIALMCKNLGIHKIATSGYQPQANAHVERFHRYMNAALTMYLNKYKTDWSNYLDATLMTYRVAINRSTGFSPFYLLYGRHPTLPLDAALNLNDDHYASEQEYGVESAA